MVGSWGMDRAAGYIQAHMGEKIISVYAHIKIRGINQDLQKYDLPENVIPLQTDRSLSDCFYKDLFVDLSVKKDSESFKLGSSSIIKRDTEGLLYEERCLTKNLIDVIRWTLTYPIVLFTVSKNWKNTAGFMRTVENQVLYSKFRPLTQNWDSRKYRTDVEESISELESAISKQLP